MRAALVGVALSIACSSGNSAPCLAGSTKCGATCVNLQEDQLNCGACGTGCTDTQRCVASACTAIAECLAGSTACGGTCVNTQSDQANCGACSHACGATERCVSGSCTATAECLAGSKKCGSTCVDVQTDQANCGDCSQACGAAERCVSGACTKVTCTTLGTTDCGDGVCRDLNGDPANCGHCGTACAPGAEFCSAGACARRAWEEVANVVSDAGSPDQSFSDFTPEGETKIYAGSAAGGNPFQVFDEADSGWTELAPVDAGFDFQDYVAFARVGGALHSIQGSNIFSYDIASNTWTTPVNDLVYQPDESESSAADDGIVYASWRDNDAGVHVLIRYNPVDAGVSYSFGPSDLGNSEPRVAWDSKTGRLYLGDYDTASSGFYAWDPADGGYTHLSQEPDSGVLTDAFCSDRQGHIFSGNQNGDNNNFWMYTAATDTWTRLPDLPFPIGDSSTCTCTADGWLYFGNGNTGQVARLRLR